MDEPFSALDPITRSQLQDELLFLQAKLKKTIVFVTHDMDEAVKLADRICIMKDGMIVQYDTPEQIMKNPVNDYVANFVGKNRIWANPQYIIARDIMIDAFAVPEELSCLKAIDQMRHKHVNSAMVVDDDRKFMGIAYAKEIQKLKDKSVSVKDIIKKASVTAVEYDNIVELLKKVNENSVSLIPVLDDSERLTGLITSSSLVTTLSQQYIDYQEVDA